jgi:hypothetical protein
MQIKKSSKIPFQSARMVIIKETANGSVGEDMEQREHLHCWREYKMVAHIGEQSSSSSKGKE